MFSKKGEREYYDIIYIIIYIIFIVYIIILLYYIILFSSLPPYTIIFIRQLTFNF